MLDAVEGLAGLQALALALHLALGEGVQPAQVHIGQGRRGPRTEDGQGLCGRAQVQLVETLARTLAAAVEGPDGFQLVPEPFQAHGMSQRRGEAVDDAAAAGHLPRFVNRRRALEAQALQAAGQLGQLDLVAGPEAAAVGAKVLRGQGA